MMDIQRAYLEKSRHKIPLIFMADIIHGYKTIFPIPLALAGSFSTDNFYKMARASAAEASLSGIHVTFSPMADMVKDIRWGRVMEAYGEDPYLNYHYAYAMTKGYQGKSIQRKDSLAACVKHFAAYGAALAGRDYAQASISLHEFYQQYDAGYRGAIDAGVRMAMTSFNVFEGIPATINQTLLKKVLRKRMGFRGVTISDYDSIIETVVHRVSIHDQDAVRQAMLATVDVEMASGAYIKHIPTLVKHRLIDLKILDQAVLRVLKLKKDLGLFANPYKGANIAKEKIYPSSKSQQEIAKQLADESIVLLKNDNATLPIKKGTKIALLGKMSDSGDLLGPWSWHGNRETTSSVNQLLKPIVHTKLEAMDQWDASITTNVANADVLVVMTGEEEKESGEARSKVEPQLHADTVAFIQSLKSLHKPIILVLTAGRPLIITDIINRVDAVLFTYFLGTKTAHTIVDTLYGINNPSAKLTMSFPRHLGQVPISYNHLNTGRPFLGSSFTYTSHYIDSSNQPLFSFGHGLSYSKFSYEDFKDNSNQEQIMFDVTVRNLSSIPGFIIILIYLEKPFAQVALPNQQLVGMKKVFLKGNKSQVVSIPIDRQFLTFIDEQHQRQSLKGILTFSTGPSDHPLMTTKEI
jgi:beta-glucosidase